MEANGTEPTPSVASTPERPPRSKKQDVVTKEDDSRSLPSSPISTDPAVAQSAIKSILKRPTSMPAGTSAAVVEKDSSAPGYDTIRLNHTLVQRLAKLTTNGSGSDEGTTFGKNGTISARNLSDKRNSGSQFYLPTPFPVVAITSADSSPDSAQSTTSASGRKKVHFLVENEIIHDDDRLFAQMLFTEVSPALASVVEITNGVANGESETKASLTNSTELQTFSRKEPTPPNGVSTQVETEEPAKVILLPAPLSIATKASNGTNEGKSVDEYLGEILGLYLFPAKKRIERTGIGSLEIVRISPKNLKAQKLK
uniref:Uncharacterized protein n=1 Tax=Anopheles maculatus TaxID=74869 RepID=A0A182TCA2_9DIPT